MIHKYNAILHESFSALGYGGYSLSEYGFTNNQIPNTINITLSLKLKKKRILISGKIDSDYVWDGQEDHKCYYFFPNNPQKLKNYLREKENEQVRR